MVEQNGDNGEEKVALHHAKPEEEEGYEDGNKRTDSDIIRNLMVIEIN